MEGAETQSAQFLHERHTKAPVNSLSESYTNPPIAATASNVVQQIITVIVVFVQTSLI